MADRMGLKHEISESSDPEFEERRKDNLGSSRFTFFSLPATKLFGIMKFDRNLIVSFLVESIRKLFCWLYA